MAINNTQRGFTLLIAVIFMTVMLSFGLALGSLGYKQITLSSTAKQSQYAFYAADAGLECGLYADQRDHLFSTFPESDPTGEVPASFFCGGNLPFDPPTQQWISNGNPWIIKQRFELDAARCVDVSIYKYSTPIEVNEQTIATYIFAQGYDVRCASVGTNVRAVSRGQYIFY